MMLLQQPLMQAQRLLSWLSGGSQGATAAATGAALAVPSSVSLADATPLFGDIRPWNESGKVDWVSVDDRVRGGSSQSHLEISSHENVQTARFFGTLDTKTLGGAGFASVTTQYSDSDASVDLSSHDGILLRIAKADDKRYTFILKDEIPDRRHDGRMKSGISWEYDFYAIPQKAAAHEHNCSVSSDFYQICIPWKKFNATYRGREVKNPEPLKTEQIKRFSIMIRSFFDKQDGDFEAVFHSIWAYSRSKADESSPEKTPPKAHL